MDTALPAIPAKRYFTIGEVSELCGVKAYVLRYWEQEFTQLRPMKRRGNRRYYQHHEVLLIRRIRELLYDQGFTISGARNRLAEAIASGRGAAFAAAVQAPNGLDHSAQGLEVTPPPNDGTRAQQADADPPGIPVVVDLASVRDVSEGVAFDVVLSELRAIRALLED
ncbi:MAG: MerR family transcriptional regulator [Betaproteobacteria bacterium]